MSLRPDTPVIDNPWIKTKSFHYRVDITGKEEAAGGNVTYLQDVTVIEKIHLNSSGSQWVHIGTRKFLLILLLKIGRLFRAWIYDTATKEVFYCGAREVDAVSAVPAGSRAKSEETESSSTFFLNYDL